MEETVLRKKNVHIITHYQKKGIFFLYFFFLIAFYYDREVDQMVQNRIFRLMPRNRVSTNSLKKNEGAAYYQNINEQDSFVCKKVLLIYYFLKSNIII